MPFCKLNKSCSYPSEEEERSQFSAMGRTERLLPEEEDEEEAPAMAMYATFEPGRHEETSMAALAIRVIGKLSMH